MKTQEHLDSTLQLRTALMNLQKELLSYLKEGLERESGRSIPPGEWLQVIMVAQRFAWLRELTSLVADIDLLTELQDITEEHASLARSEVERLFFAMDSLSDFNKNYQQLMKNDAPFMISHSLLREATQKLPKASSPLPATEALTARKGWHQEHHLQSRKRRS